MKKSLLSILLLLIGLQTYAQIAIGSGTDSNLRVPVYMYYKYSYSQTIYKNWEINANGEITGLKWHYAEEATSHENDIEIYLGQTTKENFTSEDQWIPVSELTKVFDGTVSFAPGWVEITFDTPFTYDNTSNLVVAAREKSDGYNSSSDKFFISHFEGETRTLATYSDTVTIDPYNPATDDNSDFLVESLAFIPNVILVGIESTCPSAINVEISNITTESAVTTWENINELDSWKIHYKKDTTFNPTNDSDATTVSVEGDSFSFSTLEENTYYYFYIESYCSDSNTTVWSGPHHFRTKLGNVTPPYTTGFENEFPVGWSTEANSGNEWTHSQNYHVHEGEYSMRYNYSSQQNADSWLFTNPLLLEGGKEYTVKFWVKAANSSFNENLKFTVGSDASIEAQTTTLLDLPNYTNDLYFEEKSITFTPESNGVYHFGFQCYSEANKLAIYIDDFSITKNLSTNETTSKSKIALYPNPIKAGQKVNLTEDCESIVAFTSTGKVVLRTSGNSFLTKNWETGIYFIQITLKNGQIKTAKLLVK